MTCAWKVENTQLTSWSLQALRPRVMGQILQVRVLLPPCWRAGSRSFDGPGSAWQASQAVS